MNLKNLISSYGNVIKEIIRRKDYLYLVRRYMRIKRDFKIAKGKIIEDIKSYFSSNLDEIKYHTLSPEYEIEFSESEEEYINKINISNDFPNTRTQKEVFSSYFEKVKFSGMSGAIFVKKKGITQSTLDLGRFKRADVEDSIFLRHKKLKGLYTSIMHLNWARGNSIYHWIFECLPRLYAINQLKEKEIFFIINEDIRDYQLEHIKLILDKRFKIIKIKNNEVWYLEKYFFASFVARSSSGYLPSKFIEYVRNTLINRYKIESKPEKGRIYISRARTSRRRLKNEEEFVELIKKYGFKRVFPEFLPYKEQIDLFHNSKVIIMTAGSAIANLIFSRNIKFLMIYSPFQVAPHVITICKGLGIEHNWLVGYDQEKYNADFHVDLAEAEKKIKELTEDE